MERYFATCARGLEPVLAGELRDLGSSDVEPGRGGVGFAGDKALLYRANLWLRTAIRVLMPVLEAPVTSPEELYDAVRSVDWSRFLTADHTLAVDCNVRDSRITHSKYAALKTKDAICDQFVEQSGRRPSVDVDEPMVGLNLHIYRDQAVLSLDSSGESLHKRGYRTILSRDPQRGVGSRFDPLNRLAGRDRICRSPVWIGHAAYRSRLDGFGRPPGLTRRRFGFQGWMDFDVESWAELPDEARRGVLRQLQAPIAGSDIRRDAITFSINCARAAGIGRLVRFERQEVRDFQPPAGPPGTIICNPPYGLRIGDERALKDLYRTLGEVFRQRCAGWSVCVFTGNAALARHIGLEPLEQVPLFNGKIPCRLLKYRPGA